MEDLLCRRRCRGWEQNSEQQQQKPQNPKNNKKKNPHPNSDAYGICISVGERSSKQYKYKVNIYR